MRQFPNVLTIAGSDSSAGAGIQADIRTFTALKVYGTTVVTNVTAQNSQGVHSIHSLPACHVEHQLNAVLSDIDINAIKIGMLYTTEIINSVAKAIKKYNIQHVVVDPVLISTSGTALLHKTAKQALVEQIFPLAHIITPNLPEAASLQEDLNDQRDAVEGKNAATVLSAAYQCGVLVKGGHQNSKTLTDHLAINGELFSYDHQKIETNNTHGTGCTLSSAIAAYLALGYRPEIATEHAIKFTQKCLEDANLLNVGNSYGPINQLNCLGTA